MSRRPVNCNGCGRFMVEDAAAVGPDGATRWYSCDHCGQETTIDEPPPLFEPPTVTLIGNLNDLLERVP